MRILIFNWKDIKNPEAGGAEVFTHEVAKRWVADGHEVTLFTRLFDGCLKEANVDGVRIVRRGNRLSVYREATRWYRRQRFESFDLVIDEINTRPFGAPSFVRDARVLALIYQLAADVWREEAPFPLSTIGSRFLEPRWLKPYSDLPTATISASTQADLIDRGFKRVSIVPIGLTHRIVQRATKDGSPPTVLFVGRLVRTKRPHHALEAFRSIQSRTKDARFWVVGDGYMRKRLERNAPDGTTFFGRVSEDRKFELMSQAHVLLFPSVREGWGLVVSEANSVGTVAVGYRAPGIVDAIQHEETGLIVDASPEALAAGALSLIAERDTRCVMEAKAHEWSQTFTWDRSATELLAVAGA